MSGNFHTGWSVDRKYILVPGDPTLCPALLKPTADINLSDTHLEPKSTWLWENTHPSVSPPHSGLLTFPSWAPLAALRALEIQVPISAAG